MRLRVSRTSSRIATYPDAGARRHAGCVRIKGTPFSRKRGHWYYIELHVKLNTPGVYDGVYDLWLDDCGTNGLGCTGSGTLRAHYTNVFYRADSSLTLGGFWFENFANVGS